jgi:thiamine biosynthesis lipoprotein
MGTVISHKVYGRNCDECLTAVWEETKRLEEMLSRFIPGSDISRINKSSGIQCEKVSPDTYEVLSQAVKFSRISQGLFDITLGPLVTIWGRGKEIGRPPEEERINQLLPLVDYHNLILKPEQKTVLLQRAGQTIDLGGIGKGFAGDMLLKIFKRFGITSAFTNIGGNVVTLGTKPEGTPWRIGIRHPRQEGDLIGIVSVENKAVVTSGDYQRYFTDSEGKRYHHILDPSTGYPSETGLLSVTVVTENSMTADALSTILFVAGMNKGIDVLKSFPEAEAIFIDTNLQVYITRGLKACYESNEDIRHNIL